MGINLSTSFLSSNTLQTWEDTPNRLQSPPRDWRERDRMAREPAPTVPRPPFDWIVRHVLHAIDVGGEDCVGPGGDLDGTVQTPKGLDGVENHPKIAEVLRNAGFSNEQIDKVCHRSFVRVFEEVLPS